MAWISFGALPCWKKKLWQLASRCCWNRARPWHASELVSFLVGLRTYQHPGKIILFHFCHSSYNNARAILSPILLSYSSTKLRISCLPIFSILDSLYISSHQILITWHVSLKPVHSLSRQVHSSPILYSSYRRYSVQKSYLVFPVCHSL